MAEEEREKILLVFITTCQDTEKKKSNLFLLVTQEEYQSGDKIERTDERQRIYSAKGIKCRQPGAVYDSARYLGFWKNEIQRFEWQAEHRAKTNEEEARALEKKESTQNLLVEQLEPIRELYRSMPHFRRQALLTAVVYYITK